MLYFAYGSNLNKAQMSRRCPAAIPVGPLILPNARLVFRGVADIEWHATRSVHGGLWHVTRACERELDVYEGVRGGLYRKEYLQLKVSRNGQTVVEPCLVYLMNRSGESAPSVGYFEIILRGFADFGLDESPLWAAVEPYNSGARSGLPDSFGEPDFDDDGDAECEAAE